MNAFFSEILNMSMTASVVIVFVLLTRLALRKAPKVYSYALWAVVLFRLLCPVALSAPVSALNLTGATVVADSVEAKAAGTSTVTYFAQPQTPLTMREPVHTGEQLAQQEPVREPVSLTGIACAIWLMGAGVMVLYSLVTYGNLRRRLEEAVPYRDNIHLADHIDSPFVLGLLSPKIYLPSNTPARERQYIIAHEKHHIRRFDHIVKVLAYGALCLHWFNPLVWAAFILGGKDMEMSCDEAVIKKLGTHIRADYSASLLRLATHRTLISGTPLAFGEGDTKGRVLNMARWKQPKLWVSILCAVICTAVLAACAVNPQQEAPMSTAVQEVQFNDLYFTLPSGYDLEQQDAGVVILAENDGVVGGVNAYPKPEMELFFGGEDPSAWNSHEWQEALGLPEAGDMTLGYMGSGSTYGDFEVEYFRDLPEEEKEKVGDYVRFHTFFIGETQVYDVWFDRLVAGTHLESAVLKSVHLQGATQEPEPAQPDLSEEVYLERCRYAMEEFRDSKLGWGLQVQRCYSGEEDYHYSSHWCQGTSRLDIFSHPTGTGVEVYDSKANLLVNKEMYHGTASTKDLPNPGDLDWQAGAAPMDWTPWLTTLDWANSDITYMDTLVDDGAVTVMLRIDMPYYEATEIQDLEEFYFVNFLFNEDGGFLGIDLMVGLFREGGFTQQERIVTDGKLIADQIAQAKP